MIPARTIVLPAGVTEVINVLPLEWGPEFGPPARATRGLHSSATERRCRQDRVAGPQKQGGPQVLPAVREPDFVGRAATADSGESLRMSWDAAFAPYCGVWIDEGYLNKII